MPDPNQSTPSLQDNAIQPSTSTAPDQISASAQSQTAPSAPMSQQAASGQTAAPNATPGPAPSPAQAAQNIHGKIFQHVLSSLAGQRPVVDPNTGRPAVDANGTVLTQPGTAKTIGASILAGAISGLVAGWASPDRRVETGGGRSYADNSGAAAAGAQAGAKFSAPNQVAQAQSQADDNQARMYATTDHNLKFHQLSVAADKADRENQQAVVDAHSSMNDAMDEAYANGNVVDQSGKYIDLYKQRGILGTEVQKLISDKSLNITADMITPVSVIDVPNRNGDGGSHAETLFDVFNPSALVNMSDAIRKDNPRLTDVANGTPLPVRILASNALKVSSGALASSGLDNQSKVYNDAVKGTNIPAISSDFDLASAAKKNPLIEKLYPYINKYRKDTIDAMFNDFQKDPNIAKDQTLQTASALLQQAMGVTPEGLQKMATQRADVVLQQKDKDAEAKVIAEANAKRLTPEGQADLLHKQLENQSLIQSAAQAKAQGQGIQVPKNFTANPKANEMEAGALQSDLSAKGVDVPSNFSALYAIAHNAADLSTLPTTPRKGVNVMPRDQALSFIRTYINPQYQEGDYSAAKKLSGELASTRTGTAGGTLLSAGTAANHLSLLEAAGQALNNKDVQGLNRLANTFGIAVGKSPAVTFQAIAEQVNSEVAKVVAGGQPNEAELKQNRDNLNNSQSPEQIRNVIRSYVGLMNGRIGEIDDRSMQYFGRHVKGISPTAVQVFNQHGFAAPGQVVVVDPTGKQRFFNDEASANNFKKLAGIQ